MQNDKKDLLSGALFQKNRIVTEINPSITIRGRIIATEQNLITISGLPKSRKTVFSWAFVTSFFSGDHWLDIKVNRKDNRPFLLIDTESGDFSFSRNLLSFQKRLGIENIPDDLYIYLTREYNHIENKELIKQAIEKHKPSFILIDNITDLVCNLNDPEEAQELVKFLKIICSQNNCTLITLIHLSKSNNFTIGWLGSTIDRASQSVLSVTKDLDTGTSTLEVKNGLIRDDDVFKPITIEYDNSINDYFINGEIQQEPKEEKKNILKQNDEFYINMVNILFVHSPYLSYSEICESLKQLTGSGLNNVKKLISLLLLKGYLLKNENSKYVINQLIKQK